MATQAKPKAKTAAVAARKVTQDSSPMKPVSKAAAAATKAAAGKRAAAEVIVSKPSTKPATKATAKATAKAKPAPKATSGVGVDQRRHYVEVAAFFIAERRGFAPGNSMADWLSAEAQVDQLIAEGKIGG